MNRFGAKLNDLKIGFFEMAQPILPATQSTFELVNGLGKLAVSGNAISSVYGVVKDSLSKYDGGLKNLKLTLQLSKAMMLDSTIMTSTAAFVNKIYEKSIGGITRATLMATTSQLGLNLAMLASPVGLVVAGILALVAVFKYLWDHSKRFREILFGIWEAAKAVFNNIGIVVKRVWDMVVKPILNAYWSVFKFVWGNIWEFIKWVFKGIASAFVWLYDQAVSIFTAVKDFVVGVFNWISEQVSGALSTIGSFFSGLWDWFSSVFSGFAKFIDEWLVQPLKNAFGGVWDWIVGLFEKIMDKLTGVFAPIKKFFKTLFSSEGMTDVKAAYKDGEKKGAASYDKDHPVKANSQKEKSNPNEKPAKECLM